MNAATSSLELILEPEGDELLLLSPGVGWFTRPLPKGHLVSPGADLGALRTLSHTARLIAPSTAFGRISSPPPALVQAPVDYRAVLYRLSMLDGDLGAVVTQDADAAAGGMTVNAAYAGRFWHRPAPSEPALVSAGDAVEDGTALGLIEVMKTFSAVPYRATGGLPARAKIVRLLVDDGAEVETGTPLVEIEPA